MGAVVDGPEQIARSVERSVDSDWRPVAREMGPRLVARLVVDYESSRNASIHVSRATNEWLQRQNISVLPWRACSPELIPMENIWGIIVRQVHANNRQFQSTEELKWAIIEAWRAIDEEHFRNLVSSMPRRPFDVALKQGGAIDY
ncbi:unnamed protein product [Haemonchus placei]|uniref:DDE_3 domain-containing protein n=1 Tax=Haemonchus placei TaxID=6290 RepID=A0A0N4X4G4_HAEPC|nr:unnamed protein product [Haemonchus placei]